MQRSQQSLAAELQSASGRECAARHFIEEQKENIPT